jgi:hypothetical protein
MNHASRRTLPALVGALVALLLLLSTSASAAPITVNLRVEGATKTLYEGPVNAEPIEPPGIEPPVIESKDTTPGAHPCDVSNNGENGGFGATAATPTGTLYEGAVAAHLSFAAGWFASLNDFRVEQVGEDVANSGGNGSYWGYAVDFTTAEIGGCQIRLAPGSEVLWAYNFFNLPHLLSLSGPTSVDVDVPFTVHVVDGQTGAPIAGAAVGQLVNGVTETSASSPTTDAAGNATVTLSQVGTERLKATQPESVRSNGVVVCVHNGNDGTCGTTETPVACPATSSSCGEAPTRKALPPPPPLPDVVRAGGVLNGHLYSRRGAPRILEGSVEVPFGNTLHEVRIALERSIHHRCFAFGGRRGAFVRASCHATRFFDVADTTSFSYLLPARLPAGRYVYDIEAVDDSGQVTSLASGVSHVVFYVK